MQGSGCRAYSVEGVSPDFAGFRVFCPPIRQAGRLPHKGSGSPLGVSSQRGVFVKSDVPSLTILGSRIIVASE